ncbi:tyrosine-protein kinase domain-containing protein [Tardiphaga sp.]|uniref:exopolysaccharide transport family protein n=1 Tax=Tardiphaga sp. TaxID=1926292 RepID=UPI002620A019|nr:tyrosine-protein kinase domain-containing protein [Tardiphaga sp.]MDB5619398.1 lipopolysaccharide biosynthesis [Tardiphaga sp.]
MAEMQQQPSTIPAPPDAAGPSPVQTIWRHRSLFAAVFCGVLVLTAVLLVVLPVRYLAVGSVIVAEQEPGGTANVNSSVWAQKIGDPADVESQLLVIRSPRLMRLAMAAPGVVDAAVLECQTGFGGGSSCDKMKTDSGAFVDYVSSRYSIGAVGRSRVINISYTSSLGEVAQTMANALTNAFLADQRVAGSDSREIAASYLWKEVRQLDAEVREADSKIQAFRRTKGLMRGSIAPISSERLTSISQQLSTAEAARADALARLQEIKASASRGAFDAPSVLANRSIADLKQQLTVVAAQYASQANVLGPRHPSLRALEQEQIAIKDRMTAEVANISSSAQKAYDANDTLVNSLKKQMETVKSEVGSATSDEASIESMVRGTEIKRQQYADLYKRASELETERRVLIGSTRLVSLAELPAKPFFPKKIPFLAAGATIGLLLALSAAFFGDRFKFGNLRQFTPAPRRDVPDEAVPASTMPAAAAPPAAVSAAAAPLIVPEVTGARPIPMAAPAPAGSLSELAVVTGAPILARLPSIRKPPESAIGAILTAQSGASLTKSLALAQQDRAFQDGLRQLSAGLFAGHDSKRRHLLVASPAPAEGKTFLTLALAQYLAMSGRNVLVVECDLGAPKFEAALGLRGSMGLQGILRGDVQPRDVVVRTSTANLDAIAAGPFANSADLIMQKPLADLLQWSQIYDVVLIDGPSPTVQLDIGVLARQVDGVLMCMRTGRSSIGQAIATSASIRAAGGDLVGIAITMAQSDTAAAREVERMPAYAGAV